MRTSINIPRRPPPKIETKVSPKLITEYGKLVKLLDTVKRNEQAHDKQMSGTTSFKSETMFGSIMGASALTRSQLRYHTVRWRVARRCVQRRVTKLANYISKIEKKK